MRRPVLIHLLFMLFGYALAVLAATTVVVLIQGAPTVFPDQGRFCSLYNYLNDFPMMFTVGCMMTAIYGLPAWLVSVSFAELKARQGKYWFAFAGVLTSMLAILIAGRFQRVFDGTWLNMAILIGGFCGGLAYWAVAGKTSANWKTQP